MIPLLPWVGVGILSGIYAEEKGIDLLGRLGVAALAGIYALIIIKITDWMLYQ